MRLKGSSRWPPVKAPDCFSHLLLRGPSAAYGVRSRRRQRRPQSGNHDRMTQYPECSPSNSGFERITFDRMAEAALTIEGRRLIRKGMEKVAGGTHVQCPQQDCRSARRSVDDARGAVGTVSPWGPALAARVFDRLWQAEREALFRVSQCLPLRQTGGVEPTRTWRPIFEFESRLVQLGNAQDTSRWRWS
jgi:hypothetical protein